MSTTHYVSQQSVNWLAIGIKKKAENICSYAHVAPQHAAAYYEIDVLFAKAAHKRSRSGRDMRPTC